MISVARFALWCRIKLVNLYLQSVFIKRNGVNVSMKVLSFENSFRRKSCRGKIFIYLSIKYCLFCIYCIIIICCCCYYYYCYYHHHYHHCIEEAHGEAVRYFSPRCHIMPKWVHVPWKAVEWPSHLCEIWSYCLSTTSHTQFLWLGIVKGWCMAPA